MQSPNPKWVGKKMKKFYTEMPKQNSIQRMNIDDQSLAMPDNSELTIKKYARPKQNVHFNSKENIL